MNDFNNLINSVTLAVNDAMNYFGDEVVASAKQNLLNGGHYDSGDLYRSIRQKTEIEGDNVVTYIYADAKGNNGAQYAEFIELGSGANHGRPGGRQGSWRYKDRHGKWHTTDGMNADPFLEPAVIAHIGEIAGLVKEAVSDIAKYGRL